MSTHTPGPVSQAKGAFLVFHAVDCAPKLAEALRRITNLADSGRRNNGVVMRQEIAAARAALAEWDNAK